MMDHRIEQLKRLPQQHMETWQGGLFRMPRWVTGEGGKPYRPLVPLWVAVRDDKVHSGDLLQPDNVTLGAAVEALLVFACESEFGGYRPGRIEVCDSALAEHLAGLLADAEIEIRIVEGLDAVLRVLHDMETFGDERRPRIAGLLEMEGVTLDRVQRFAEAAGDFYRAIPWRYLTDADLVRVEEPKSPPGMEHAVVLGAGRAMYGLAFYRTVEEYARFRRGMEEGRGPSVGPRGLWQLSFNPITQIPLGDADLWEDHGLPVVGDKAYPALIRIGPSGEVARPGVAELAFAETVLRAFARTKEEEIDSGRWQKEVTTHDGPVRITLAIPDLLNPPTVQEWMKRGFTPDQRAHERSFADMHRYFEEHPPASMEEMNAILQSRFTGKRFDELVTAPQSPLDRAQDLCYQAFDTFGRRRVHLARQALEISFDCADAYVILAEQAGAIEAELENYTKGTVAGDRALGRETFEKDVGHFWGITHTRPYMRARFGLARTLEAIGRVEEAVEHYQELLRLNPRDNQGVRYLLMPRLLELGRDGDAARLLKESEEESAAWTYARALLAFRLSGKSVAAGQQLREAFRVNPYVPEVLAMDSPPPTPNQYRPGSPEEALVCVEELLPAFRAAPGALQWVAAEHAHRQEEIEARRREKRRKERQRRKKGKGR